MKKQDSNKLTFNKEKVANLSQADLDQVVGGKEAAKTDTSTHATWTCTLCTTLTGIDGGEVNP